LSRSGKTAWAILKLLDWSGRGWGWCWLSIKGGRGVLPYLPSKLAKKVDLISPTSPRPRGINMLRLATGTAAEREQVADQTADILDRLHPTGSDLMREMVRLGTLALLEHGVRNRREVSLPDLYTFFASNQYRQTVLGHTSLPAARHTFGKDPGTQRTLEAVQRQVRRLVSSRALMLALGRSGPDQADIRQAMAKGRAIVVDATDADLGPGQAALINEVIASKIQLYTAQRGPGEPPFGVVADEVQEYQGAGHSFRRAFALAGEYRVAWVLVNQFREGQLSAPMQAAVSLAGSHVFFRLSPADAQQAAKVLSGSITADQLVQLRKRHFWTVERREGRPIISSSGTPDLPDPNQEVEHLIRQHNAMGQPAERIVVAANRLMEQREGLGLWA